MTTFPHGAHPTADESVPPPTTAPVDIRTLARISAKTRHIRSLERNGRRDAATEEMARLFYYVENCAHNDDWHQYEATS